MGLEPELVGRLRRPTNSGFRFGTLLNRTALK